MTGENDLAQTARVNLNRRFPGMTEGSRMWCYRDFPLRFWIPIMVAAIICVIILAIVLVLTSVGGIWLLRTVTQAIEGA